MRRVSVSVASSVKDPELLDFLRMREMGKKTALILWAVSVVAGCGNFNLSPKTVFTAAEKEVLKADIVIPANAGATEKYAAEELKYHLDRIVGRGFGIVTEDKADLSVKPCHFFVGATEAAQKAGLREKPFELEERRVKTVGNGLYLLGGDRDCGRIGDSWAGACHGTLYAVYDFLTKSCGVRWIWPGEKGEVIPKRPELAFGAIDRGGVEPIGMRLFYGACPEAPKDGFIGFRNPKAREKYYKDVAKFLIRHHVGSRRKLPGGHSFQKYWERFGKTHPEFFNLLPNGKREPLKGDDSGASVTMCVSEPGLWKQIAEDWRGKRGSLGDREPYLVCCENDSPGMCTCPKCRALDAPSDRFAACDYWNGSGRDPLTCGNRFWRLCDVRWGQLGCDRTKPTPPDVSDRYAYFYNQVLAEARKVDPGTRVMGYGYSNYAEGPKHVKISPGVTIEYVPRTYFPYHEDDSALIRREWDAWRKAGADEMFFRPNYMLAGSNFPMDFGRNATSDFAYLAANGLAGCRFDSLQGAWANQTIQHYALLRCLSEPTLGYDAALGEVCAAFGPAAEAARKYFKFIADFSDSVTYDRYLEVGWANRLNSWYPAGGHNRFANVVAELYPDSFFVKGAALLDAAERAAAGDSEALARVRFLKEGLEDARLTREARIAHKGMLADNSSAAKKAVFEAAFKTLLDYRAGIEPDDVADYDVHARNEEYGMGWPHQKANNIRELTE